MLYVRLDTRVALGRLRSVSCTDLPASGGSAGTTPTPTLLQ
jgi:hypothetical protein